MNDMSGSAFPTLDRQGDSLAAVAYGMTLRDYFAAKAMAGYCAVGAAWDQPPEEVARCAFRVADAMLEVRSES